MKFEKHILSAFSRLGFKPRNGQVDAINKILVSIVDENIRNIILNAPTGTGKSIIGAVTAESLSEIRGGTHNSLKSSIMLCSSNVLSAQYFDTFKELAKDEKYIMIKGANNYNCSVLSTPTENVTADSCAWYSMVKHKKEFNDTINTHCNNCEYMTIKNKKNNIRHLTTNYSYFFVDRMYTHKFEQRDLVVWDEAHLVNDLFSEHNSIMFSQKRLQNIAQEIADTVRLTDLKISKSLLAIAADCGKKDKINNTNYHAYLRALHAIYSYAKCEGQEAAEKALRSGNMPTYSKLSKFINKYEGLACKIDDFFKYAYEHIFEYKEDECLVSVKPVFVGTMMDALQSADHNLFMSATISEDFALKTLNLDPNSTKFIKLDPTFSKDHKEFVFFDPLTLNYSTLQNPETVKQLCKNILKITNKHVIDGDRGIILTPSFKLQASIVEELDPLVKSGKMVVFEHKQGEKLEAVLQKFKNYTGLPAILISPSMFEGIDLPGHLSRFQILVKAPFPSLGDKRMKFILDRHPEIYNIITIMKMVQGAGRSVRSVDDYAITYCLDNHGQRIFNSKSNIWKDEFNIRFTKFL